MAGIFSDGSFGDYFGETDTSPQGSYGAPGVFSYGQYNQEQAMRRMNPKDLASMQTQQMTQQKKAMEMQKMQEGRALEMQMKQAVSEASKYGPDAIASVYEQFGDAKTAMDIRKSGAGLKKLDLETAVLLQDYEKSKNSAAIGRVIQRISSLPANQRAQEWESLIPYLNQQMGSEIPEQYSPGALIGLQSIQQGIESNLQTVLSNPRTAKLAEPALRAMADPAVDKYFNDLIAAKKASLGPDLVTRANQVPMTREESRAAIADYQRRQADDGSTFQEYKKLDPETEKAKEQAQYELGQERQAQAQELSNAMAELASQENPSPAAIARVKALAESVRAGQTPLVVAANEARDAQLYRVDTSGDPDPNIDTSRTYTTKTDKDGNITYSESVKEAPKNVSEKEALAKEMASLQDSLSGLDLPPSTYVNPKDVKGPLSTVGKLQADYKAAVARRNQLVDSGASDDEILAADNEVRQLEQGVSAASKTGGGITVNVENGKRPLSKEASLVAEKQVLNLAGIENNLNELVSNLNRSANDVLTVGGRASTGIAQIKDMLGTKLSASEYKQLEANAGIMGPLVTNLFQTMVPLVGTTATDRAMALLNKSVANSGMGPNEAKIYAKNQAAGTRRLSIMYNDLINQGVSQKEAQKQMSSIVEGAGYNLASFATDEDIAAVSKIPRAHAEYAAQVLQDPKASEARKAKAQKLLEKFNAQ